MLSSNQIPYDLSRRKSDQFYGKVVRESPFDTIVFIVQDRGVSVLKDRAGVSLYADFSLLYTQINSMNCCKFSMCFAFMHVPRVLSLFNILKMLTICPSFGPQMQSHRFQISCNRFERPKQWLRIQILNGEESGLNTVVYAKGRTKKENEHIKYNLTLHLGTID